MFKTQAEIMQAVLDGKKIRHTSWIVSAYVGLIDGYFFDEGGRPFIPNTYIPSEWEIYEEPKIKKKVKMLCYHDGFDLHWRVYDSMPKESWTRVPSEDKEIEV